ncbi:MAG: ABC transporter permease [Candidatus Humimicrobiaceae bacterium]
MTKLVNLFKLHKPIVFSYMVALFLLVTVGIFRPAFVSGSHLKVIASQAAIIGIISLGQTLVIIIGGVDLSIPWTLTSAAILVTNLNGGKESTLVLVIPAILFGALLVGLINGIGVAYLEINPIIMTFGVNIILSGALIGATGGTPGNYSPKVISRIVNGSIIGVPNLLIFWIVIIIVITIVLVKTPFGRYLCATGTNPCPFGKHV